MDQMQSGVAGALAGTRPWVRLVSVLGFLGAAFIMLLGFGLAAGGLMVPGSSGEGAGAAMAVFGVVYACMGLLYLVPSLHLWRYGTHIHAYVKDAQTIQLEQALEAQRRFWKFVGILAVLSVVVGIIAGFLAVMIPAMVRAGATP
jgi:hypothetical protein